MSMSQRSGAAYTIRQPYDSRPFLSHAQSFYGNRGRINARDLWEQMNSCSCLTLILACIIYWQAKDISRVIRTADPERHGIELSLLRHVSPIEWDNIVLYGEYVLNRRLGRARSRP